MTPHMDVEDKLHALREALADLMLPAVQSLKRIPDGAERARLRDAVLKATQVLEKTK